MDSVSKAGASSSSRSFMGQPEALQGEDDQGRKVSDVRSDASHQQLRLKVIQSLLVKPSLAMKLRSIASFPLNEGDLYIKKIDSAKTLYGQQKAIEGFVDVLFKAILTDDTLVEIQKCIDSSQLTPRKLSADYMSLPCFLHVNDLNSNNHNPAMAFEDIYLKDSYLSWRANPAMVSNEARLTAINAVLDWVYKNIGLFTDKTLTLISLGSGYLLMEHLIHQELLRMGVSKDKIQWRCIDPSYLKTMEAEIKVFRFCQRSIRDFKKDKQECVLCFSTEKAYLNKKIDDANLSTSDKGKGPVVILSFVQHCIHENLGLMHYNTKEDMLVGRIVKDNDFNKANAICLVSSADVSENKRSLLRKMYKPGSDHAEITNRIIRAWIDLEGSPKISFGYNFRCGAEVMRTTTSVFLQAFNSNHSEITPLKKLKYAFEQVWTEFDLSNASSSIIFPFSDYFVSLNRLNQFFFNVETTSNDYPGLLCELVLNEVTMTEKQDGSEAKGATSSRCWKAN